MSDDDPSKDLKEGSDRLVDGVEEIGAAMGHFSRSISVWFNQHPVIRFVVLAPVSAVVGWALIQVVEFVQNLFYGRTAPIGRDIQLGTFPIPVGLSLWLLTILMVFVIFVGYFRFVSMRQKIERMEEKLEA